MRPFAQLSVVLLLLASSAFAQQRGSDQPSFDAMFSSFAPDSGGKEISLTHSIDTMVQSLGEQTLPENTDESVQTAITGPLVVEEVIPDVNREVVEAIDRRTNRYSPRIKLDFENFSLVRSGRSLPKERVVKQLQLRLRLEQPISVEFHERTASLHGTVNTERQKELATIHLRLEPGVDIIRNELRVKE